MAPEALRVIVLKPSKYGIDGCVERFRRGFMPNSTVTYIKSLTPERVSGVPCEVHAVDEYVQTDLGYLSLLQRAAGRRTLLALVGVQSHQLHRALDLAAFARARGVEGCIIGGPHPMTCDTSMLEGRGVSFALSEAEIIWPAILRDTLGGALLPVYGEQQRWQRQLESPVLQPPHRSELRRYIGSMLGIYPARGCPYTCSFCSVIKIAGRTVRSQPIETTLASLRAARAAGVRRIMFTSDNFNKYPEAAKLLEAMIEEDLRLPFFVQCDTQIYKQEELVALMARAGCFQMFVGVESFSREALRDVHKLHNHPDRYAQIIALCRAHGITTHFSNIIGFPSDTEAGIKEHLRQLRRLEPDVASFYILTPMPGTEQYADFLARGLISESNLDRFDGSCVTWRHPHLSPRRLNGLLYHCYREFNSARDIAAKTLRAWRGRRGQRWQGARLPVLGFSLLSRYSAARGWPPMAGGAMRVRRDGAADYAALRRRTFGIDLAPLPGNLELTPADERLNREAKLVGLFARG
jgi:Radical SAM superfamily